MIENDCSGLGHSPPPETIATISSVDARTFDEPTERLFSPEEGLALESGQLLDKCFERHEELDEWRRLPLKSLALKDRPGF